MIKKTLKFSFLILFLFSISILYAQETTPDRAIIIDSNAPDSKNDNKSKSGNVNLDAKLLYGMHDYLLSSLSMTQSMDDFSYQLITKIDRIDDYYYNNSFENETDVGFTGTVNLSETYKLLPVFEIRDSSKGLFDNSQFSEERKRQLKVELKNEYKPTPSKFDFNLKYGMNSHEFISPASKEDLFHSASENIKWEYVISGANKMYVNHSFTAFFYEDNSVGNDYSSENEILGSFKIIESVKINLGGGAIWDKDEGFHPTGKINLASSGFKYVVLGLKYSYKLRSFKPDSIYYKQNFIFHNYDMDPEKIHHAELKGEYKRKFSKKSGNFFLKKAKLKSGIFFEKNSNFYNFTPVNGTDILTFENFSVITLSAYLNCSVDFKIFNDTFKIGVNYIYNYYNTSEKKNITYKPMHSANSVLKYKSKTWEITFENSFYNTVYTDSDMANLEQLKMVITGKLEFQYNMSNSFHIYSKIDNIYNYKYAHRFDYYKPGVVFSGGLRIII